jgi:hypothetical protein
MLTLAILVLPARAAGIDGVPTAEFAWELGEDLPYMGSSAAIGDFDGDGDGDLALGGSLVDAGGVPNTGRIDVFYGTGDGWAATADMTLVGEADTLLAYAMIAADVNGDGYDDLVATVLSGARVYYGAASGLSATPGATLPGGNTPLARAGDVDGDGYEDVLLGDGARKVTLYRGSSAGPVAAFTYVDDADFAAGEVDIDGDGAPDVILGDASASGDMGVVRVYRGAETTAFSSLAGTEERVGFGRVLGAGDADGDGFGDVAVSAINASWGAQNSGTVKLYGGSADGLVAEPLQTWSGPEEGSNLGWVMAGPADFDGDGFADVVIAGRSERRVYVYGGDTVPSGAPGDVVDYGGAGVGAALGLAVGDATGDGCDDLLVGGPSSEGATAQLYAGNDCPPPDDGDVGLKGGCGCTSGAKPHLAGLLVAILALGRRGRDARRHR